MVISLEAQSADCTDSLASYTQKIRQVSRLTREQESELAQRIERGDQSARDEMITANLRLVVKIAHDYDALGLPLPDLVSEGNIGLMHAVDRFDYRRGVKFSSYAAWWIKHGIRRALSNCSRTIRLPVNVSDEVAKLNRLNYRLTGVLGREPTDTELADELDFSEHRIATLRATADLHPCSLDASEVGEPGDNRNFGELLADTNIQTPDELLMLKTAYRDVRQQLQHLTAREAEVITSRFGLDSDDPQTLEQIGRQFNLTRESVRRIQDSALAKLRRRLERQERRVRHPQGDVP